jgi:hypothetical protein
MMSSAVRATGAVVYTAATWAIRRVCRFSPLRRRVDRVGGRSVAAAWVAGRRSACRTGKTLRRATTTSTDPYTLALVRRNVQTVEGDIAWLDELMTLARTDATATTRRKP